MWCNFAQLPGKLLEKGFQVPFHPPYVEVKDETSRSEEARGIPSIPTEKTC